MIGFSKLHYFNESGLTEKLLKSHGCISQYRPSSLAFGMLAGSLV